MLPDNLPSDAAPDAATLKEVAAELRQLVRLTEAGNLLAAATNRAVADALSPSTPAPASGATGPAAPHKDNVRLYHGGEGYAESGGKGGRWVSGDRKYAEDWAEKNKASGAHLQYADVPKSHPQVKAQLDAAEHATGKRDPRAISHFELEPEHAKKLKRYHGPQQSAGPEPAEGGHATTTKPPKPPKPERGLFGRVRDGLVNKVKNGRSGQAYSGGQKKVGGFLGGKGASGLKGLSGAAGMAAKAAGPIGVVVAVGDALNQFRKAVIQATDAQIQAAQRLAEVSGSMAAVFAKREVSELSRDVKVGRETADSTGHWSHRSRGERTNRPSSKSSGAT